MSRRSTISALCASNGALESATRRIVGSTPRTFSSTARQNASIGHFTPTSSPQLDELLNMIRQKIILPAYLPREQRKKLYSPKYEKKLRSDPVTIEIDGEVIRFRYTNPFIEMPQTRRSVLSAISQFQTADDFVNLQPLIEGTAKAQRTFDPSFYCKVIRILGQRDRIYDAIELARSVSRTDFRLDCSEKVNEILHFVQMKAVDADWDPVVTARVLRWSEMVLEMLEEEEHQPEQRKSDVPRRDVLPLHRDPMVLLAPLHLAASLLAKLGTEAGAAAVAAAESKAEAEADTEAEVKIPSKEEVREKLNKYANDIVRLWPEGKKLMEIQPKDLYETEDKMEYLTVPNKFVVIATPLLYGLEAAIPLVEPELAAQLKSRRDILAAEVQQARKEAGAKPGKRGEIVYQKIYGDAA
ncbi:uncharacterized protein F4822DRAFT_423885 [Hypoxylon trugodes]|uniref:uncharacterized protein n=1 Tax=Hypoxylon trugodes TaxID=326681 RepID=UPI002193B0A7|nr:uncharacterized protein F4822DRAFT_423885 [Hypoxylon trugodes]KAI1393416.1 hypothetical protein F4822DRAFT_423885 [Hypoxylon trugodes]